MTFKRRILNVLTRSFKNYLKVLLAKMITIVYTGTNCYSCVLDIYLKNRIFT